MNEQARIPWHQLTVREAALRLFEFVFHRFRFSLKSFMVVVTALVLCLSTYQLGRQQGLERGFKNGVREEIERSQRRIEQARTSYRKQLDFLEEAHRNARDMDRQSLVWELELDRAHQEQLKSAN